jgi:AcrR family transcriptional regulator
VSHDEPMDRSGPRNSIVIERPRGRPRREQADAARQRILDAALGVFLARGFAAASMEGIAREAGVAKLTLYRHFESKQALFVEVARRAQLSVRERLGTIVDRGRPLDAVLRDIIGRLYDGYTHPEYLAVLRLVIAEAGRFPELGRAMLDDSREVSEPLVQYLQQLKDRGQIDVDSPSDAVTQICGLAMGAGRYVLTTPSRRAASRRHAIESLVTLFSRAWRAAPRDQK